MERIEEVMVPPCACPACGTVLTRATIPNEPDAVPKADDCSVCINCAAINKFDKDLKLVAVTEEEFLSFDRDMQEVLTRYQVAIKTVQFLRYIDA